MDEEENINRKATRKKPEGHFYDNEEGEQDTITKVTERLVFRLCLLCYFRACSSCD
jgi:hypothetical protein